MRLHTEATTSLGPALHNYRLTLPTLVGVQLSCHNAHFWMIKQDGMVNGVEYH